MTSSIALCICTSGRPTELKRCLDSVALSLEGGGTALREVVVADDSEDPSVSVSVRAICDGFRFAAYAVGPRRGLCANRNFCIRQTSTSHISLVDDDAVLMSAFLKQVSDLVRSRPEVIFTGDVLENGGRRVRPSNPRRLGHFGRPVHCSEVLRNVHLNCNVFPRAAFEDEQFDERLVYGYEDTDLCDRLVRRGWRIVYVPELVNRHLPPARREGEADERGWLAERERFAVVMQIARRDRGLLGGAVPMGLLAALHAGVSYPRWGAWSWLPSVPGWFVRGLRMSGPPVHSGRFGGGSAAPLRRGVERSTA